MIHELMWFELGRSMRSEERRVLETKGHFLPPHLLRGYIVR